MSCEDDPGPSDDIVLGAELRKLAQNYPYLEIPFGYKPGMLGTSAALAVQRHTFVELKLGEVLCLDADVRLAASRGRTLVTTDNIATVLPVDANYLRYGRIYFFYGKVEQL